MQATQFQPGQKISTPSGRKGTVEVPNGEGVLMPFHCLVQFKSGERAYVLAAILKLDSRP